jgi:hypothetical protein
MTTTVGFVAFIDVLGFRSLLSLQSKWTEVRRYIDAVDSGIDGKAGISALKFVVFSDSIIITTIDDSPHSLIALIRACSRLVGLLLEAQIAIRGAIAHGEFVRDVTDNGVFVAGPPIVDAYDFEGKQDWAAIMLTPSVLRKVPDLQERCAMPPRAAVPSSYVARLAWTLLVQRFEKIPFQNGREFDGFVIVPTPANRQTNGVASYITKCAQHLHALKLLAAEPEHQRKYARSANWLNGIAEGWTDVMGQTGFPADVDYSNH